MFNRAMMIGICCFFLFACSFTDDKSKKPIHIPKKWHHSDKGFVAKKESMRCFSWWKQFDDPVLQSLIEQGLKANNELQIALANIEAAQGELKRVELNWLPGAGSMLGYSSFPYLGYPGVIAVLLPAYTINLVEQFFDQKRAKYELSITKNLHQSIRLAVIAEISANYFSYLSLRESLSLLSQMESDQHALIAIYQSAFEKGLFNDIDVEKLKTILEAMKTDEMMIRNRMVVHQNAIRFLLNDNPGGLSEMGSYRHLNQDLLVVGTLPLNTLEDRPDILAAENELRASNAGVNIAASGFLPTIQLSMARGDIATKPNGRKLGQPVYFNQALLETPLVTLSTFGSLDKAKGLNKASYFRYQQAVRKALKEVDDDLSAHDYFSRRFHHTQKAEQHFGHAYALNEALHEKGVISHATLLQEKIKLYRIKMKLNQHKLNQLLTIVRLYQDLGVGQSCPILSPSEKCCKCKNKS